MNKPKKTSTDNSITLEIPSDQKHLPEVEAFVTKICKRANFNEDQSDNMAIAVTELVNNGIIHANQFAKDKTVTVHAVFLKNCAKVSVIDQGSGFDPDEVANPIQPENLWKQGGRGIFLVRNLIHTVEISPTPLGTTVILTEYLKDS